MTTKRVKAADERDFMQILRTMHDLCDRLDEYQLTASICQMSDDECEAGEEPIDLVGIFRGDELVLWEPRDPDVVDALRALLDRWDLGRQASEQGYEIAVVADHQGRALRLELERGGVTIDSEPVPGKTNAAIKRLMRRNGLFVSGLPVYGGAVGEA
jgi:hypothetical protein